MVNVGAKRLNNKYLGTWGVLRTVGDKIFFSLNSFFRNFLYQFFGNLMLSLNMVSYQYFL
jgi:hypothetical protein